MLRLSKGCAMVAALASAMAHAQGGSDTSRTSADVLAWSVYTDNFYYGTGDEPHTSVLGAIVTPRATHKGTRGKLDILASLGGEFGSFDAPGSADDYEDANASLSTSWLATRRSRLDLRAAFQRSHDPFGVNRTEDATVQDEELDVWHGAEVAALFHYGAPEATLNAEVGLSAQQKQYQTNEAQTRFLDYTRSTLQYTLFYNFSPKTATLFDFVRTDVLFEEPFGATDGRSGDEYRVRTGLRWLATAKTSGDVRVGVYRREFEDTDFSEQGLDWQAGLTWAPRARTLLDVQTARGSQESYRADTRVNLTRSVSIGWKQYWGVRITSHLTAQRSTADFVGLGRKDSLYNVRVGLDYSLTRQIAAVLAVDSSKRDSNDPTSEFDRFSAYLGARLDY